MNVYTLSRHALRLWLGLRYAPHIAGALNIPTGNGIIVANHRGALDIPLIVTSTRRPVHFLTAQGLYDKGEKIGRILSRRLPPHFARRLGNRLGQLAAWYLHTTGTIPIEKREKKMTGTTLRAPIKTSCDYLSQGGLVAIFPEGIRSQEETLLPFKSFVALLAARSKAPVIPVGIRGTDCPARGGIRIAYGTPFSLEDFAGSGQDSRQRFVTELEGRVAALSGYQRPQY
jgi:1-acyl-sn-glycerol-3-phosphate acyltransferase